ERLLERDKPLGWTGIAHTRWATHGRPTEANAHPHVDCGARIFVVHNGIIENYLALKKALAARGHRFESETDTEVLAHLIEDYYAGSAEAALRKALQQVQGTFGLAMLHADRPREILLARRGSPIVLGVGKDQTLAASDVAALAQHTDQAVYLEDNEVAR